ncbi:isochorismatase family cysteine hydrolase [Mesorhizobium sp. VK25A]|uniref:Isochorismatase family cysteine hydrolase n=1 Tax=Mesorhizobium vachelliae TaxID=3072309 RepID=A0ABU5A6X8_9HYPH|nr:MULTISPECIES: isochorismatase family cysteine hydrolase [unclassified Mesorhizobium]MDX8532269.1 isochorismatase family cysteine hydrolase [Mesorhizobium sp. VK25D]MDX8545427.1 isochorismatase family cysteine hydrolase [Mesorhizobium sp. VK25A]
MKALIALHFQNDICHPDGLIPFAVDRSGPAPDLFLDRSRTLISRARDAGWLVAHVHIAFQLDYSDLLRNAPLFRAAGEFGALKRGTWGAAPMHGFEPAPGDVTLIHSCNNAFQGTGLEGILRERAVSHVAVAGLATQYSVEHTVRHAADLGYVVTMVRDCCGSANEAAAQASFAAMAMLARIVTLDEIEF